MLNVIYLLYLKYILFQCVGVDPHVPSASAAPSSVSPTVSSFVLSKSIRFIFLMRVLYSGLKLYFGSFPHGHCETVFVNSLSQNDLSSVNTKPTAPHTS